jgi:hypothetical protein
MHPSVQGLVLLLRRDGLARAAAPHDVAHKGELPAVHVGLEGLSGIAREISAQRCLQRCVLTRALRGDLRRDRVGLRFAVVDLSGCVAKTIDVVARCSGRRVVRCA